MTKANSITTASNNQTMSSVDLLKIINKARQEANEPQVRLNKFNEKIEDELGDDHYTFSVVKNPNNTESIVYQLDRDQCILLSMRESKIVRRSILQKLKDADAKSLSKQNFALSRKTSKDEYLPMTNAIAEAHEEIKPYHFSNESDLINRITFGMTASKFRQHHDIAKNELIRDYLSTAQLNCIIALQRANTVYIEDGLDFQIRKQKLTDLFNRKHKQKLIDEIHMLSA